MSGIAEVLRNLDYEVSGSDLKASNVTRRLEQLGCTIHIGHREANIQGAHVVVMSSAVKEDNPEIVAAHREKIPVIPRAEMLAELMRLKYGVAIAGTHGKTSTTSMVAGVLQEGGLDPTVVIGGRLNTLDANARLGKGDFLVAEADESDGSFLMLSPTVTVVTNIDREHMEHYGTMKALHDTFLDFINKVPFYGVNILCLDDPGVQQVLPYALRRYTTYGIQSQSDVSASEVSYSQRSSHYVASAFGKKLGPVTLNAPGRYSVLNSLAAIAVGLELGLQWKTIAGALGSFESADRRFQIKGEENQVIVVDDYGHHPTEIRATLEAAKEGWSRRIVAVFQPHRYSRVKDLQEEFSRAFYDAETVVVTPVYAAGEAPLPGVNAESLAEKIRTHGHRGVHEAESLDAALDFLKTHVRPGDMVIMLGAGDVNRLCDLLLSELRKK